MLTAARTRAAAMTMFCRSAPSCQSRGILRDRPAFRELHRSALASGHAIREQGLPLQHQLAPRRIVAERGPSLRNVGGVWRGLQTNALHRTQDQPQPQNPPSSASAPGLSSRDKPMAVKVWIIYYSTYGHIKALAEAVKAGAEEVEGVEASIYQVAETLSDTVLAKMHAPAKADHPIIDPHTLTEADGFVFGFPTRFGMMCAQMKAFFDATGQHWAKGALVGKPAGLFTSTASQGGGQEVTILTAVTQLAAHGMPYIPVGYTAGAQMQDIDNVRGGSPYGAGTYAGPTGARQPTEFELAQAKNQGKVLAIAAKKLK